MGLFDEKKDQGAIRPNTFFNLPKFARDNEALQKGLTEEERVLAVGAGTEFWLTLKTRIEEVIKELENVNELAVSQGAPLDEIGRNAVVINLTKGVLRRTFNFVDDAHEAMNNGK